MADLFEIDQALGLTDFVLHDDIQSHWLSRVQSIQHLMSMKAALVKLFMD